ncbi:NADP-dependent oxidoreductase domain-containing protein [Xylariales sp. PMI_506]|nr:NADP-dependent oxidoreductase domain-containing protein [Xylariales sp. PMI_506]
MGLTWRAHQTPDDQAFAVMSAAIENGAVLWSAAEFYGVSEPTASLQLIRRYFEAHPENADSVTLFVKGCTDLKTLAPLTDRSGVRGSAENCLKILGGAKRVDVFGPSRIDPSVPLEETLGALRELVSEGKIGGVGLSEVGAATLERAHAIQPLSLVEVEFSLWSTDILTNGVAATAKRLDLPIVAYAPLGRGFLTGQIRSPEDIPAGDIRLYLDRFQPESFGKNLELVEQLQEVAARKNVTPAQLALTWVRASSNTDLVGRIIPIPGATTASRVKENNKFVTLSEIEKVELDDIIASFTVHGGRYNHSLEHTLWA